MPKLERQKTGGRPKAAITKERITIRLSPDVVGAFRSTAFVGLNFFGRCLWGDALEQPKQLIKVASTARRFHAISSLISTARMCLVCCARQMLLSQGKLNQYPELHDTKQHRTERLVVRGGRHFVLINQHGQKRCHISHTYLALVA